MKILDRLERLARTEVSTYADLEDWADEVREALPALIRVARAAERVSRGASDPICFASPLAPTPVRLVDVDFMDELKQALRQLRELGGEV